MPEKQASASKFFAWDILDINKLFGTQTTPKFLCFEDFTLQVSFVGLSNWALDAAFLGSSNGPGVRVKVVPDWCLSAHIHSLHSQGK